MLRNRYTHVINFFDKFILYTLEMEHINDDDLTKLFCLGKTNYMTNSQNANKRKFHC